MNSSESRLAWLGIIFTSLGLIISVYYNHNSLQAARMESELKSYLTLNERYHQLMFSLVNKGEGVFFKEDDKENKYCIYELFDLISTVKIVESHFTSIPSIKADWDRKIAFFLSKPAVKHAWRARSEYATKIYSPSFINYIDAQI
ncbi:MAG: hypothetical protein LLF94_03675 [Chlamydiales bacterium]|nr:hypothetical protein [Chlamydiales bacterium]